MEGGMSTGGWGPRMQTRECRPHRSPPVGPRRGKLPPGSLLYRRAARPPLGSRGQRRKRDRGWVRLDSNVGARPDRHPRGERASSHL